jgi:hypothetical protein
VARIKRCRSVDVSLWAWRSYWVRAVAADTVPCPRLIYLPTLATEQHVHASISVVQSSLGDLVQATAERGLRRAATDVLDARTWRRGWASKVPP